MNNRTEIEEKLLGVLGRNLDVDSKKHFMSAFNKNKNKNLNPESNSYELKSDIEEIIFLDSTFISIDTNIINNLQNLQYLVEAITTTSENLKLKNVIITEQVLQEYWNGSGSVITNRLKERIGKLVSKEEEKEYTQMFGNNSDYSVILEKIGELKKITEQINNFDKDFLENLLHDIIKEDNVYCSSASRSKFIDITKMRHETKTPPGFKDNADGDFYVWLDTLYTLLYQKHNNGKKIDNLIIVTDDKKIDWVYQMEPHPILCMELYELTQSNLYIIKGSEINKIIHNKNKDFMSGSR